MGALLTGRAVAAAVVSSVLIGVDPAMAAGFALKEQGVSGLGNAYAGSAAVAEDASTIFFNPAGLARLRGNQTTSGISFIAPEAEFTNVGSNRRHVPLLSSCRSERVRKL